MGLSLIAGPANAGKVALLLERYLAALARVPVLIVPNRSDVERVERDLLARSGALLGGSIGTFDDVFERIAQDGADARPLLGDAQRTLLVRRIVGGASLNGLGRSARFAGFADSLATTFGELESGLLEPSAIHGDLARLFAAYRAELDRLKRWDRDTLRRHAVDRLQSEFTRLKGPQQIPRIAHLTILLARKPLLDQPLLSRPHSRLDLSTHSCWPQRLARLGHKLTIKPGRAHRLREILKPLR